MLSPKLFLLLVGCYLMVDLCQSATIRDAIGRQMNFPDSETNPESEGGSSQPRGFIQRIFDMIKNFLGLDSSTTTTVMRSDGTMEEVEVPSSGGGGFLSRISRRLFGFLNNILNMFTGNQGSPQLDGYSNSPSRDSNEIERLMKMVGRSS